MIRNRSSQRNRPIKETIVKRFPFDGHGQLRGHLADFLDAYNFARRLTTLDGLMAYEHIGKCWTEELERFRTDPDPSNPGHE